MNEARHLIFVCPRLAGENLLAALAVRQLENVELLGILESSPAGEQEGVFSDYRVVGDVHDTERLSTAARLPNSHTSHLITPRKNFFILGLGACIEQAVGLMEQSRPLSVR